MRGTAVIIGGVPATILPGVLKRLVAEFPQGYIFRGRGTSLRAAKSPHYDNTIVEAALAQAADALFGSSRRPFSFCRNPQRKCAVKAKSGRTCGRKEGEACPLDRPSRLILAYQEAANEQVLLKAFYHSALARGLPSSVYANEKATAGLIAQHVRSAKDHLRLIEQQFTMKATPLLLPPKAFRSAGAVTQLIKDVNSGKDPRPAAAEFRKMFWQREGKLYVSDNNLGFKAEEKHGIAGAQHNPAFALSAIYRLGCEIAAGFHWNVAPPDGSNLNGRWTFDCRESGERRPTGSHANIFADDRLR